MSNKKKTIRAILLFAGAAAAGVKVASYLQRRESEKDAPNPLEGKKVVFVKNEDEPENADGVCGHLQAVGETSYAPGFYEKYVKRGLDIALSFGGIVVLSPVLLGIAIAIKVDDPGPVFFTQKRIGQNKKYFRIYKFRSMKMATPHDVPTHMLENPDQYITKVGKFLRAHSLDELSQLFNVLDGSLSLVGPRPGLWNQDLLTAERDKYGVNEHKPGITGWAQINGRDSISIEEKSKLDGVGVKNSSLLFDLKCLLGTFLKIGHDDSVVEGGTGTLQKNGGFGEDGSAEKETAFDTLKKYIRLDGKKAAEAEEEKCPKEEGNLYQGRHFTDGKSKEELIGHIGFDGPVQVDTDAKKRVLITGAGSYVGESFREYAEKNYGEALSITELDLLDEAWREYDFSEFDIVYHVAGIAHADTGSASEEEKERYYKVNTDLAVEVCEKAKAAGVREFIFMSSMIVYGDSAPCGTEKVITAETVPAPASFYGDSKLQADVAVREFADESFHVIVLRPPMIYGKGSKGNYPMLAKIARIMPVFPGIDNHRSMLYIENLCEFLCQLMLVEADEKMPNAVVLMPQNAEWMQTSEMVKLIREAASEGMAGRSLLVKLPERIASVGGSLPGKLGKMYNKAFGNFCYELELSEVEGLDYCKYGLEESVRRMEEG